METLMYSYDPFFPSSMSQSSNFKLENSLDFPVSNFSLPIDPTIIHLQLEVMRRDLQIQEQEKMISTLKTQIQENQKTKQPSSGSVSYSSLVVSQTTPRFWTKYEHRRFLEAVKRFGRHNMKSISKFVGTRSSVQAKTHAQKYFRKLFAQKEGKLDKKEFIEAKGERDEDFSDSEFPFPADEIDGLFEATVQQILNMFPSWNAQDYRTVLEGLELYVDIVNESSKIALISSNLLSHLSHMDVELCVHFVSDFKKTQQQNKNQVNGFLKL